MGEARHVFIDACFGGYQPRRVVLTQSCHPERGSTGSPTAPGWSLSLSKESEGGTASMDLPLRVFEMGFGSGLNCWLTLLEAEKSGLAVDYVGVEKFPVPPEVALELGYTTDTRFAALHTAPWGAWTQVSSRFRLLKLHADLTEILETTSKAAQEDANFEAFDVVYWDAFAPDVQPELWTEELFGRVYEAMADGGVLATYSAKGDVRRALLAAGFAVEKLPGALGKRHMLRAVRGTTTNIIL